MIYDSHNIAHAARHLSPGAKGPDRAALSMALVCTFALACGVEVTTQPETTLPAVSAGPPATAPATRPARQSDASSPLSEEDTKEDAEIGREVLEEILGCMKIKAEVNATAAPPEEGDRDRMWILDIKGPDLGVMIGRRGETLDALQYITRLIVSRDLERRANIVVDVEGYKSRREGVLRKLAQRMADQARKLNRTVTLEPMPPNERRIIHITLREDESVLTESVGAGDRRKVTIIPADEYD